MTWKITPRSLALALTLTVLAPASTIGAYLGLQYWAGNFHEVEAGQLYRSGQLNANQIRLYTERYGIRSIVNLRGASTKAPWYLNEVAEAKALGVTHVDFRMSAGKQLTLAQADELEKILRYLPKPILVHCEGGSDRSGLASAIFMNRVVGEDIEQAEGQISLFYGHFSIPYLSHAYPMDQTWAMLEQNYRLRDSQAKN